jgi:hypothetical protein
MQSIMKEICKEGDISNIKNLEQHVQDIFIDYSYDCLCQKIGDRDLAIKILIELKEIIYERNPDFIRYIGKSKLNLIQNLIRTGITSIQIYDTKELPKLQQQFDETLLNFPEYKKNNDENRVYVLGGFAALGNPSSYHNEYVRNMRKIGRSKVVDIFKPYIEKYHDTNLKTGYNLEMLYDRMMFRLKGMSPSAETLHRDVMKGNIIEINDELFGGWINLDTKPQYFSCIQGSHLNIIQKEIDSGFSTLENQLRKIYNKEHSKTIEKYKKDLGAVLAKKAIEKFINPLIKSKLKSIGKFTTKYEILPGHMVIFPQYILHEVLNTKASYIMRRLFTGWRLTLSDKSIYDQLNNFDKKYKTLDDMMSEQSSAPTPSGQETAVYAKQHAMSMLGIPKINNIKQTDGNYNKWGMDVANKFVKLYPTVIMKELFTNIKKTKNNVDFKTILVKMLQEYNKQGLGMTIPINEKIFINDNNIVLKVAPFQAIAGRPESLTTVSKWSYENFHENMQVKYVSGKGEEYYCIPRCLNSLEYYNLPLYKAYSDEEKQLYKPSKVI